MLHFSKKATLAIAFSLCSLWLGAGNLIPASNEKGKWGFIDSSGQNVIGYKYDQAQGFENGLALVRKGDNYGMIDENGKEIIPVKYNIIERHNKNIFRVAANGKYKDGVLLDEKYGFIDSQGKVLLKPEYNEIGQFTNGVAYIKKEKLYGYINDMIQTIVPCKYNVIGSFNSEGYVWVGEGAKLNKDASEYTDGKYGIYDRNGKVIVEPKYKSVGAFTKYQHALKNDYLEKLTLGHRVTLKESGSHHLYRKTRVTKSMFEKLPEKGIGFYGSPDKEGYKNSVVSLSGEVIVKDGKYHAAFYPTDGWYLILDKKGRYNYVNLLTGKQMFKKPVNDAWAFDEGIAVINREGKGMELIDINGNSVSSTYKYIFPKNEGLYIVQSGSDNDLRYGAIDKTGKEVIAARQRSLYPPVNGMMACYPESGTKCGYMGLDGKWVLEPIYESTASFKRGLAWVMKSSGCGLIDPSGKEIVKCIWKGTKIHYEGQEGYVWVTDEDGNDAGYMLLRITDNKLISNTKYKWSRNVGSDFKDVAMCGDDNDHLGIIDTDGKVIIPMEFNYNQACMAYKYLQATKKDNWEAFDTYRVKLYSNPERNKARLAGIIEPSLWDY